MRRLFSFLFLMARLNIERHGGSAAHAWTGSEKHGHPPCLHLHGQKREEEEMRWQWWWWWFHHPTLPSIQLHLHKNPIHYPPNTRKFPSFPVKNQKSPILFLLPFRRGFGPRCNQSPSRTIPISDGKILNLQSTQELHYESFPPIIRSLYPQFPTTTTQETPPEFVPTRARSELVAIIIERER